MSYPSCPGMNILKYICFQVVLGQKQVVISEMFYRNIKAFRSHSVESIRGRVAVSGLSKLVPSYQNDIVPPLPSFELPLLILQDFHFVKYPFPHIKSVSA